MSKIVAAYSPNVSKLISSLSNSQSMKIIYQIIETSSICVEDIEPYRHFETSSYGRNLIYGCSQFEMILICWKPEQESAIHDHDQSDCIMRCISGKLEETRYIQTSCEDGSASEIKQVNSKIVREGDVTYINNDIGLHKIRNINEGVSFALHVYFPGIRKCHIFNTEDNSKREIMNSFTSEYGVKKNKAGMGYDEYWNN
ncbi:cysteine dioxygenase [Salinithrix halophila]|uniref:Cysteine dioxygenase n=1 Tax=Salinithrix halophila TaxID=1485204 RepID=A0ABV8JAH8_9BACL